MARVRWSIEELRTLTRFAQDVLPAKVQRRQCQPPGIALAASLYDHRDFPGPRAVRHANLVAQDVISARPSPLRENQRQRGGSDRAQGRP